jgi:D-glucuronyl C5-epimerase C-terminus
VSIPARRFGVALASAVAVALLAAATAMATAAHDASLARRGVSQALQRHWVKAADAQRYRADITHAMHDLSTLPKLRAQIVEAQLAQLTTLWDSYTSPRALALFSQLEENLAYLETHAIPPGRIDVADADGVVFRWFGSHGLEFHPLASFGALNAAVTAQDVETTRTLADALVARAIPRGPRLIWEYAFRFGFGRPPWASGMAQAVAAQALARAGSLLQDHALVTAAARAYASVQPLVLSLQSGPWILLYGFDRELVLNAQLQAVLSLLDYGDATGDGAATALAQQMIATAQALLPRFDTGDWSLYELGGAYATKEYQLFVTQLLAKLATRTQNPFWTDAAQRFHGYYYDPPQVTPGAPPPTLYPQPQDGFLDVAQIPLMLSQNASLSLSVAGQVTTFRVARGQHTITWTPPQGLAPGTYTAQLSATNRAGRRATVKLAPLVVAWDTTPPPVTAQIQGSTLSWQGNDPGTPWLALAIALTDPNGVNPPQTLDLGQQATSGSAQVTIPPGTWQATLQATSSAGLTMPVNLGTITA